MKNMMTGSYVYKDEIINFDFYTNLSAASKVSFVSSVTNTLVGENYNYIIKDLIFDYMIIKLFTTVDTSEIDKSTNPIDMIENFLYETNIVDIVKANVQNGLIEELKEAVNLNIEYRTGIHTNPLNQALTNLVNTLENKVNSIDLDSAMEMAKMFSGMTDELTPENIVKAYTSSDVFKKNMAELEVSKKQKSEIANNLDKAVKSTKKKSK